MLRAMSAVCAFITALALIAGPAMAQAPRTIETRTGRLLVETIASGLVHPWGMAFLPDATFLVTERPGRLRLVGKDGAVSDPLEGTPDVFAQGQGGLLDVALDPQFADNRLVYLSFAEAGAGGASTAVGRGRLEDGRVTGFQVLFRQEPKVSGPNHFGGRIVFSPDGHLFLTLGERFKFEPAQDIANHLGTIVRINRDGSIPDDNPFVGRDKAEPAIWSYGHRNIQAGAINPRSGALWIGEMGPRGGDELNLPEAGRNYGWPIVSSGRHYSGERIPDPSTRPDLAGSIRTWTPSISPSGMLFYTGSAIPAWTGNVLLGSLTRQSLVRLVIEGDAVTDEEIIGLDARIRDVEQAPDGSVYLLTDHRDGKVLRLRRP